MMMKLRKMPNPTMNNKDADRLLQSSNFDFESLRIPMEENAGIRIEAALASDGDLRASGIMKGFRVSLMKTEIPAEKGPGREKFLELGFGFAIDGNTDAMAYHRSIINTTLALAEDMYNDGVFKIAVAKIGTIVKNITRIRELRNVESDNLLNIHFKVAKIREFSVRPPFIDELKIVVSLQLNTELAVFGPVLKRGVYGEQDA